MSRFMMVLKKPMCHGGLLRSWYCSFDFFDASFTKTLNQVLKKL